MNNFRERRPRIKCKLTDNNKVYPIIILPNTEGYRFIAILKDGSEKETIVKKDKSGKYYFEEYRETIGWKKI